MSTLRFGLPIFLLVTTCRVDPKREAAAVDQKPTRARAFERPEIYPRVIEEPQPVADAILVQPQVTECLLATPDVRAPTFSIDLGGQITGTGRVTGASVTGLSGPAARCLETALEDLLLLPGAPGAFRVNLSRQPRGAGPGLVLDPGGGKKFE